MHRVRAVAEMFDVSVSMIYRAIEAGQLKALKFGEGKGSFRITQEAVDAYQQACEQAARVDGTEVA